MQNLLKLHNDKAEVIGFADLNDCGCLALLPNGIAIYPKKTIDSIVKAQSWHHIFNVVTENGVRYITDTAVVKQLQEQADEGDTLSFFELPNETYIRK